MTWHKFLNFHLISSMFSFAQVRIARPTNQLSKVIQFYTEGLGLPQLSSFTDHAGYSGVMVGLPNREYHLEFTQHEAGSPGSAPTKDNLLVFYIPHPDELSSTVERLQNLGYFPVPPENPYWQDKSLTFEDPDGWRIVLFRGTWGEVGVEKF